MKMKFGSFREFYQVLLWSLHDAQESSANVCTTNQRFLHGLPRCIQYTTPNVEVVSSFLTIGTILVYYFLCSDQSYDNIVEHG